MVLTKFAPLLALAAVAATGASAAPRIHENVHRTLREQGTVDILVTFKTGVESTLAAVQESEFATRGQKIAALVASLEQNAKTSQSSVNQVLVQEAGEATPSFESEETLWISNQKFIKGASIALIEKLAANGDIAEIAQDAIIPAPRLEVSNNNATRHLQTTTNQWGVTKVGAPTVWASGFNGQGVVIGSIDTGVLATHTTISSKWRSSFGWFDPATRRATPFDDNGHGTHTIGSMVGANGFGVAPGARFIACRGCTNDGCPNSSLLSCAQFMTCPTNPAGTVRDCTQAPKVVNNSWGGGRGDTFYDAAISTWRAAGIIPVFAIGNTVTGGPRGCGSAASPGDRAGVISVGATDVNDALGTFSLQGPALNTGLLKPEISGPGVDVLSSYIGSNTATLTASGTSMAAPHVAAVIALLFSKNSALTFAQINTALTTSTARALRSGARTCSGIPDTRFPNHQFGYGRINAAAAINLV